MTNERTKPQIPHLNSTHPGHNAAWASYWQEKSRWQDQEIERLSTQIEILRRANRFLSEQCAAEPGVERRLAEACERMRRAAALVAMAGDQSMATAIYDQSRRLLGDIKPWWESENTPKAEPASREACSCQLDQTNGNIIGDPCPACKSVKVSAPSSEPNYGLCEPVCFQYPNCSCVTGNRTPAAKSGVFAEILSHHPDCSFHSTVAPATPVCDCGVVNPPPCECLVRDKEPSAYHNVKCPRFVEGKL
jgi:hypothetical protein